MHVVHAIRGHRGVCDLGLAAVHGHPFSKRAIDPEWKLAPGVVFEIE